MSDLTNISFPGLGIDPFTLNKVAFSIGKIEVRWYGILITCGIMLAFLYATYRGKHNENVIFDDIIDIGLWTVILGVVGARLYYVLTTLNEIQYESFLDVIAIWEGGLAIYGGIIGGCIGIVIACKIKKISWIKLFDMAGPGVMIAQALGRWGNFFNGEAFGYPIGDTTRFYFFNTEYRLNSGEGTLFHTLRMGLGNGAVQFCYHPTFFYESVWNVVGFIVLNLFYKHKKFDGQIALMYFTWYGFGRMFIEGFRTDSLYIPNTTLRISQCLGFVCFVVGLLLLILIPLLQKTKTRAALAVADGGSEIASEIETDVNAETEPEDESAEEAVMMEENADTANETVSCEESRTIASDDADDEESEEEENGKAD